jgi:hypothetical protein
MRSVIAFIFAGAALSVVAGCGGDGGGGGQGGEPTTTTSTSGGGGQGGDVGGGGQGGDVGGGGQGGDEGGGGQGGGTGLPAGCWTGPAECDPLNAQGCPGEGDACDLGLKNDVPGLYCYGPPNTQKLGEMCDGASGPFCEPTLHCIGVCAKFCCDGSECAEGEECAAFNPMLGTLGVCNVPGACTPPGGACTTNADCCSMDCHNDHCH